MEERTTQSRRVSSAPNASETFNIDALLKLLIIIFLTLSFPMYFNVLHFMPGINYGNHFLLLVYLYSALQRQTQ